MAILLMHLYNVLGIHNNPVTPLKNFTEFGCWIPGRYFPQLKYQYLTSDVLEESEGEKKEKPCILGKSFPFLLGQPKYKIPYGLAT